jgi:hypothetical protein
LVWSFGVGVIVQAIAFGIAFALRRRNLLAGWSIGIGLRFVALGVFAWAAREVLGLPLTPALIALAGFFFVTTLIEPLLLRC